MRLNVFIGLEGLWEIREHMIGDSRVAIPEIARFDIKDDPIRNTAGFVEAFSRVGFSQDLMSLVFKDTSVSEGNICTRPTNLNMLLNLFIEIAEPGTRFWFCKPENIEKWVDNHIKFYEPVKHDKLINLIHGYGSGLNNRDQLIIKITNICKLIDDRADKLNIGPWHTFNFSEYYGDSIDSPVSNMLTRLYVKGQ
jgi:hypothetical protein